MTIADKLTLLEQTKEAQRVKLGLPENIPFSRYHEFFEFKFNPSYLFLNGEQGVWYDPSDKSTLFQDVAGTVPVTTDGDPVALIKDKSGNGNHAIQETASARPIYRTDGELHWLEFDGVDDKLAVSFGFATQGVNIVTAMQSSNAFFRIASKGSGSTILSLPHHWLLTPDATNNSRALSGYKYGKRVEVTGTAKATPRIYSYFSDASGQTVGIDSVSKFSAETAMLPNSETLYIGGDDGASQIAPLNGKMYDFVISFVTLDSAQRSQTMDFVASKAGVTL